MYLAKISVRRQDGSKRFYWVLRQTTWSKSERRPIQHYVAYIGPKPVLSQEKAQALARRLRISVDDLKSVRGLRILDDSKR